MGWLVALLLAAGVAVAIVLSQIEQLEKDCLDAGGEFHSSVEYEVPGEVGINTSCTYPDGSVENELVVIRSWEPIPTTTADIDPGE